MENKDNRKREPWRMIVGMISFAFIVYIWVKWMIDKAKIK